jgi:hypothetical protein
MTVQSATMMAKAAPNLTLILISEKFITTALWKMKKMPDPICPAQ